MRSHLNGLDTDLRTHTEFLRLLESKPSPTWTIDSKQTTPEYIREDVVDETAHWRSLCDVNRQRLLDSGLTAVELEDIRRSHLSTDHWKFEAELYDAEFWRLQQLRQPQIKRRKTTRHLVENPKSSLSGDPISSRLRRRTSHNSKISKNSSSTLPGTRGNRSRGIGTNAKPRGTKCKS